MLPSGQLELDTKRKRSLIKILNKSGPSIEHLWMAASGYSRTVFHGYLCIILQRCWKLECLFSVPEIWTVAK